jgi:hypothetical protein
MRNPVGTKMVRGTIADNSPDRAPYRRASGPSATLYLLSCLLVTAQSFAREAYVSVNGGKSGHGLFALFQNVCYVILPNHIVDTPGDITVVAPGGNTSEASIFAKDGAEDLAALRLPSRNAAVCGGEFVETTPEEVERRLDRDSSGTLRLSQEDGSRHNVPIDVTDVQKKFLIIKSRGGETLVEGMSGGAVYAGNARVGMIVRVTADSEGRSYRDDVITDFWKRVRPHAQNCVPSCIAILSELTKVESYSNSVAQNGVGTTLTTDYSEIVFRLPEEWPLLPYFHVSQTIQRVANQFGPEVRSDPSFQFAFSADANQGSSDLGLGVSIIGVTGIDKAFITYRNLPWFVSVIATKGLDPMGFRVELKHAQ